MATHRHLTRSLGVLLLFMCATVCSGAAHGAPQHDIQSPAVGRAADASPAATTVVIDNTRPRLLPNGSIMNAHDGSIQVRAACSRAWGCSVGYLALGRAERHS